MVNGLIVWRTLVGALFDFKISDLIGKNLRIEFFDGTTNARDGKEEQEKSGHGLIARILFYRKWIGYL
ncbi:hypothetical protein KQX54_002059 [Cotesia glomerata]|uniref:Uncharacterized protein n=1 Tax=Cotesia glomerata TaxID=32391 RepID=A0AAV7IP56_COTGL|nr:hypothetical protein KQX54_002059 [Cotesia glomerata]